MRVTHGAQDYRCPICQFERLDVRALFVEVEEHRRLYKGQEDKMPVWCHLCIQVGRGNVAMEWLPRRASHDLLTGGTGIRVSLDGVEHNFSSAHEMRTFAAESQKRAANGEGAAMSFRALEQNHSNMDRNTLAGSQFETNTQVPHDQIGRTSRERKIGRGVLSREQAERLANHRS